MHQSPQFVAEQSSRNKGASHSCPAQFPDAVISAAIKKLMYTAIELDSPWCASQPCDVVLWDTQVTFGTPANYANRTTKGCLEPLVESAGTCTADGHINCRVRGGWSGREPYY